MPGPASLAEQYRAHREAFELALELGCTPKEAGRELRRRALARLSACGTRAPEATTDDDLEPLDAAPAEFSEWRAPWMMRE